MKMHTEAVPADKCKIIKESLFDFITSHVPNADLNAIDDVIFSYVFMAIDAVELAPEDFLVHVDDLIEIMVAYVKDFDKIDRDAVYIWLMDVVGMTDDKKEPHMDEAAKPEEPNYFNFSLIPKESKFQLPSSPSSTTSSRSNSTSEDDLKFPFAMEKIPSRHEFMESADETSKPTAVVPGTVPEENHDPDYGVFDFLTEIFPGTTHIEIKHCFSIAKGDFDHALATLIHRRENGLALCAGSLPAKSARTQICDSAEIKSRIIERYSYVDRESENKEHKPLAPKNEPKKMVRYRDNKIVSLKGERYTEVSKGEEEGVKKSNKKHHP